MYINLKLHAHISDYLHLDWQIILNDHFQYLILIFDNLKFNNFNFARSIILTEHFRHLFILLIKM